MAKDIIGAFVFNYLGDGCITSKYVNNKSVPFTEACNFIGSNGCSDPFCGRYHSVWLESASGNVSPKNGILEISKHANGNYALTWRLNTSTPPIYEGIGMLYESLLAGCYWDC